MTAERIEARANVAFAGVTTFPALLFDQAAGPVTPTPNLATLERAADRLRDGRRLRHRYRARALLRSGAGADDAAVLTMALSMDARTETRPTRRGITRTSYSDYRQHRLTWLRRSAVIWAEILVAIGWAKWATASGS